MPVDFGRYIDHTLLRPTATTGDVGRLCEEARDYAMAAVCVFPSHVSLAASSRDEAWRENLQWRPLTTKEPL